MKTPILPLTQGKVTIYRKSVLPGDELIDRANATKELYILIAHHVDCLRP